VNLPAHPSRKISEVLNLRHLGNDGIGATFHLRPIGRRAELSEHAIRHCISLSYVTLEKSPLKLFLIFCTAALASSLATGQIMNNKTQDELLRIEKDFSHAIVRNDAAAVAGFLADDWTIVDPDGGVIEKSRFLDVLKSGALTHEAMTSDDMRIRIYGNTAIVTALTTTKGKFSGQAFTTRERATDVFVYENGRWLCALSQLTKVTPK
jgi:ketosteroid isomerase-like protein